MGETEFTKQSTQEFVARMRESGITPQSANVHIKAINGYLIFLHENEYIPSPIHIKHLKASSKVVEPIPDESLKRIMRWKPSKFTEHRLYALLCILTDTGCRIDEILSLKRESVDFDNLLLKVRGKGDKERLVPFSLEGRKVLFKFFQRHDFDFVFPAHTGSKLMYGNVHRDVQSLLKKLKCQPVGLHAFRHAFASNYLRNGGNLLYLSRQL
jgi:site-specific recombinase XerD